MLQPLTIMLALALAGVAARGEGLRASFFNRSGRVLRLVPQAEGRTRARLRITRYDLPRMGTRTAVLGSGAFALDTLELMPESLVILDWLPLKGGGRGGAFTFHVVAQAEAPESPRVVGTLSLGLEADDDGLATLKVALEASFRIQDHGRRPDVVVRDANPGADVLEEALRARAAPPETGWGGCSIQ
jgi:hypothetical protein